MGTLLFSKEVALVSGRSASCTDTYSLDAPVYRNYNCNWRDPSTAEVKLHNWYFACASHFTSISGCRKVIPFHLEDIFRSERSHGP